MNMNPIELLAQADWAQALGWTLLHSLWQGAVVAAALALFWNFSARRPAQYRYLAGIIAATLMLAWAGFTFSQEWQIASAPLSMVTVEVTGQDYHSSQTYNWNGAAIDSSWAFQLARTLGTASPWLVGIWLLGLGLFMIRWVHSYFRVQSLRWQGAQTLDYDWQSKLNTLARQLGIKPIVLIMESSRIDSPLTLGHFKPVILMPVGLITGLSPEQIEAVLIHELAHIRRHDYAVNLFLSWVEVIFFYHPALWWITARIREAREHSCDDLAIASGSHPHDYARTLAILAERTSPRHSLAPALLGPRKTLLMRIQRLVAPHQSHPTHPGKAVLAAVLFMSLSTLAWLTPERQAKVAEAMEQAVLEGPIGKGLPWLSQPMTQGMERTAPPAIAQVTEPTKVSAAGPIPMRSWQAIVPLDTPPPTPPQMMAPPPPPAVPPKPEIPENASPEEVKQAWEEYGKAMQNWGQNWQQMQEQTHVQYEEQMKQYQEQMEAWVEQEGAWREAELTAEQKEELARELEHAHREMEHAHREMERAREEIVMSETEIRESRRAIEEHPRHEAEREREMAQVDRELARAEREMLRAQIEIKREMERLHREGEMSEEETQRRMEEVQRLEEVHQRVLEEQQRVIEQEMRVREEAEQRRMEAIQRGEEARQRAIEAEMRVHERAFKAGMDVLKREMIADGYLDDYDDRVRIRSKNGDLSLNGKKITGDQYEKYRKILASMNIKLGEDVSISITTD